MKRHRRDSRWTNQTTTTTTTTITSRVTTIIAVLVILLTTMAVGVQGLSSDLFDVNVPVPEFLPGATNVTVREGDVALLPCSVRNLGTKEVVWRRTEDDKFLTIGLMTWSDETDVSMDHSRKHDVTNWNLIIQHVKPSDAGIYECQVTSKAGHVRHVKLNVVGPPITKPDSSDPARQWPPGLGDRIPNVPVSVCGAADMNSCLVSITGKRYVDLGDKIHLICNASGGHRIPDEIDWFKDGDKIDSVKYRHVVIEKFLSMTDRSFISELIIDHSSLSDTGDYICRSSRGDITQLKVTVLHAESANKRRGTGAGTGREPVTGQNQRYNNDDNVGSRHVPYLVTSLTISLFCIVLTLCPAPFGLYS